MNGGSKANKWFLDGAINGVRTNYMFIDTGCEITTEHEKLVLKSAYTGEYSEKIASTGEKTIHPLAKVQLTVLGQTSEQLVNVSLNLPVDVALGQNLPLVDTLYNPIMKPALAMLTCVRYQPRSRCKTSISYQEADEDLDECSSYRDELSSNSDEGDSDEGEVGLPPTHTAAVAGQEAPADSGKKDDTTDNAETGCRTPAESGMRQMHVVESDPEKQVDTEASWEMPAEAMDGFNFHDDIFKFYSERQRLTRSKTREDRRTRSQEWSFPL